MRKEHFWVCFLFIVLLAIVLRFVQLGKIPFSLYWDEIAMYVDVKAVLQTGHDMHSRPWYQVIYPSYGDYKLPVYIWLSIASAKLFGLSQWSLRLPSAIAGVLTVIVAGLLAKEMSLFVFLNQKKRELHTRLAQLLTMLVVAVSPWSMMFSRTGFEGHVGQLLLAASILMAFWSKKSRWWLFGAGLLGGLSTYAYFSVRFVWIGVFILTMAYLCFKTKQRTIQNIVFAFLLPIGIFGVCLIPMLRSPLYRDANTFRLGTDSVLNQSTYAVTSNIYREDAGNSRVDRLLFHPDWLIAQNLFKNYSNNLDLRFMFLSGDPNLRHGTGQAGLFVFLLFPSFIAGWYFFFTRSKGIFLLLISWWLLALLPASVPMNTPHALRSLNALVPLTVVIGTGSAEILIWLWQKRTTTLATLLNRAILIVGSFLFVCTTAQFIMYYFTLYPKYSAADWMDGYTQLAEHLYQLNPTQSTMYVLPFDDRFYLWLMAYGPYSGQDFQSWKSRDYKFADVIPHVLFQEPPTNLIQGNAPFIIAGQPNDVRKVIAGATHIQLSEVYGSDGTLRYVIAERK